MNAASPKPLVHAEPSALRAAIRAGKFDAHTSGQCPGYAQANLAVLPKDYAADFLRFCQLNPKPCPILGISEPGNPCIPALGVDFYAFSGHKMYAPHGIGVLWGRRDRLAAMPPFLGGGDMIRRVTLETTEYAPPPARFEAGTPNISGAIGLGAACTWMAGLDWPAVAQEEIRLTGRLLDGLANVPGVRVLGPLGLQQRIGVVSFAMGDTHPHDVAQILDRHGVACRGGHHCAQPLMDRFDLMGTTRATIAPYTEAADIDALLAGLDEARRVLG